MPQHKRMGTAIRTVALMLALSPWLMRESRGATSVRQEGGQWRIENERITVTFDPQTGNLAVTDKASGRKWLPPDAAPAAAPQKPMPIPKAAKPITVDGDLAEWPQVAPLVLTADMLAHAKDVKDNRDCSALVYCLWDERNLYLALKVVDDACKFAEPGSVNWWEADGAEFWVGGVQVGLALWPQKSAAFRGANQALDGAVVVVKPAPQIGSLKHMELIPKQHGLDVAQRPGYVVEAAIPLSAFPDLRDAKPGRTFPFAIGINDADATTAREGQLYLPKTWVHSQPETFAPAVLADEKGVVAALPAQAQKAHKARNVAAMANLGVSLETDIPVPGGKTAPLQVKLSVPEGAAQLTLEYDMAERATQIGNVAFPEPLAADSPNCAVAVADYCDGRLYPLNDMAFKGHGWDGARLDMPWVGVVDVQKGHGYLLHLETSDDSRVSLKQVTASGNALLAPQITWMPSKSQLHYARRATYHFSSSGGYVALAKIYRGIAKSQGLVVPFTEKRKKNPNLDKLMGSWDVWGADGLRFAQAIKAAGVTRSLIHGRWKADDMRAINDMGFLTSEYDNYTDILPPEKPDKIDSSHAPIPEHVVKKGDGSEMTAWLTWDKKRQYMKRCPALWVEAAKIVMPAVLEKHPYLGRFIDVTTAEGLYECYDPAHPLVKTEKRQCGVGLLSYTRSLGLVVGGEHGIWWGVPVQDYIEGMMSGGNYSWPAGHLIRPKSKDEEFTSPWGHKLPKFERYERYGVGHQFRVPLWELVFHDCIVSYWYWGDATDWLHDIAPEVTDKKDALNILYGTPPLIWAQYFKNHRERCLQTYRNVCKLHEQIGMDELLSHEFVTEDRAVQRTRFASGTVVTVNFGEKTYQVADGSRTLTLHQHGFHVKGPRITQWLALVDGSPATFIETPGYAFVSSKAKFSDAGKLGVEGTATLQVAGPSKLTLITEPGTKQVVVKPQTLAAAWDMQTTHVFAVSSAGARMTELEFGRTDGGGVRFNPMPQWELYELASGQELNRPDLAVDAAQVTLSKTQPRQGDVVTATAAVVNRGPAKAEKVKVSLYLDRRDPASLVHTETVSLNPNSSAKVTARIETAELDAEHKLIVVADEAQAIPELIEINNEAILSLDVQPDYGRWRYKIPVVVDSGDLARTDWPVVVPMNFTDEMRRLGLSAAIAKDSVRVVEASEDGKLKETAACQVEWADDFDAKTNAKGEVVWLLKGQTAAHAKRYYRILFETADAGRKNGSRVRHWDQESQIVSVDGYEAGFDNGVIRRLVSKRGTEPARNFIHELVVSSKDVGWSKEPGKVERFEVKHDGPARVVIFVRKALEAGVVYEKTYVFYPERFDVTITMNKQAGGLYSRAYYLASGQYEDDKGLKATVDGRGDGEEVYGKNKNPQWYAIYAPGWAHSCIALSPFDHIAYWDGGLMGGIGLTTGQLTNIRLSYVLHPGQKDAAFAQRDYELLTKPVKVEVVR